MCRLLAPAADATTVDLGAGYGRLGLVWGHHCQRGRFVGYEYVEERRAEAARLLERFALCVAEMRRADLTDPAFGPEPADVYFLYDYGELGEIAHTVAHVLHPRSVTERMPRSQSTRDPVGWMKGSA